MPKLTQVINSRRGADLAVSTFRMKPAPQKYVPTLRQILGAGFLILTILALFTAFALIYYPKELRVEVDNIHQINENLHMSNLLTANLLKFGKSVRFELNGQQEGLEA
ncbi:MAG: hypothetical protein ABIQ95_16310, partial [Bdellovibrionia bacterium]